MDCQIHHTRRRFLKSAAAAIALTPIWAHARSGALANRTWDISGAEDGTLRLVFYTDIHARPQADIAAALKKAADRINATRADLVLCGGDLIDGGIKMSRRQASASWNTYGAMNRSIRSETLHCLGNQDLVGVAPSDGSDPEPDPRREFLQQTESERTYYSIDAVGYHIVVLDSVEITEGPATYRGWVSDEQQQWLKADLSAVPPDRPIVLMLHMPLATTYFAKSKGAASAPPQNRVTVNNRAVLDHFRDRNLVLVLQGHTHFAEIIHWPRTTFISGGAICANWWRGAYHGIEEGFSVLTLHRDRAEWDYIDYGWQPDQ